MARSADRGSYVILSVSEISHLCLYVILSVSEISHDQSEKYMHHQFFGGILHFVQNDVLQCILLRGKWQNTAKEIKNEGLSTFF